MKPLKQSSKMALCAIVGALSVALMFMEAFLPTLALTLPAIAGMFVTLIVIEVNKKWAAAVYFTVSILSLILLPSKEGAAVYTAFFGYFPILKAALESRLPRWADILIKLLVFNLSVTGTYFLMIKFFGLEFEEVKALGKFSIPILLAIASAAILLYDYAMTRFITVYKIKWRKYFRKLLN